MLKIKNSKGFASMTEVVVTSIMFIIAAFGIFTAISTLRPISDVSSEKVSRAFYAHETMSNLINDVDGYTWDNISSPLAIGSTYSFTASDGSWTSTYTVSAGPDGTRQILQSITFN